MFKTPAAIPPIAQEHCFCINYLTPNLPDMLPPSPVILQHAPNDNITCINDYEACKNGIAECGSHIAARRNGIAAGTNDIAKMKRREKMISREMNPKVFCVNPADFCLILVDSMFKNVIAAALENINLETVRNPSPLI